MGVKLKRIKERIVVSSLFYRLIKIPLPKKAKFTLFLNLEWIFDRLCHEMSFQFYETEKHPSRVRAFKFMSDFIKPDDVILDLGCARGIIANKLAEKAKFVLGVDHSPELVDFAKQHSKENLEFLCMDAREYLRNTDKKFSTLILSHILEHLDEPLDFLQQFKGYFQYIYIEVPDFEKTWLNNYRQDLNLPLIYTDSDHVSEFDRDEIKQLFSECNLKILEAEYVAGIQRYWCETVSDRKN